MAMLTMLLGMAACAREEASEVQAPYDVVQAPDTLRFNFLALGDSYTIGTGLSHAEGRWPVQLVERLNAEPLMQGDAPRIIAQNGWTTSNLMSGIEGAGIDTTYRLVALLIGVNNQFQNRSLEEYAEHFGELLETATNLAGGDKARIFVLSIPDYGVTPFGQAYDPPAVAEGIDQFNAVNKQMSEQEGISYFDITSISRKVSGQQGMLAPDGLHPSAEQYTLWVNEIYEHIKNKLDD